MGRSRSSSAGSASSEAGSKSVPPTRQTADSTATGMQIQHESGDQHIPSGKEAGSQVPIDGGEPKADFFEGQKPRGLQAEPALFVSNGSISSTDVPTPTVLQGVGAVATSPEHGRELVKQRKADHERYVEDRAKTHRAVHRLDEATVGRLSRAELKAIGVGRGYKMPEAGTRSTRAAFLQAQNEDANVGGKVGTKGRGSKGTKSTGSQQASDGTSNAQLSRTTRATAPKKSSNTGRSASGRKGTK